MTTRDDPVLRSSRREATLTFAVWFGALVYTVGYCTRFAYHRPVEDIQYVLGVPDWFMYGLLVPWLVCTLVTWIFAFGVMTDEDLGADTDYVAGDATIPAGQRDRSSQDARTKPR
jgi:uncharacterized membrane protein YhdT